MIRVVSKQIGLVGSFARRAGKGIGGSMHRCSELVRSSYGSNAVLWKDRSNSLRMLSTFKDDIDSQRRQADFNVVRVGDAAGDKRKVDRSHAVVESNPDSDLGKSISMQEELHAPGTMHVLGVGSNGFFIESKFYVGSLVLFNSFALKWNADSLKDLTKDHFSILELCTPTPDLIVVGTGSRTERITEPWLTYLRGIAPVECCATQYAASVFNVATLENRQVCAFLLAVDEEI